MLSEHKTRAQEDTGSAIKPDHGSYSEASKLMPEKIEKPETLGLRHGNEWFDALPNMGETYSHIAKNVGNEASWWEFWNGQWWLRTGLAVGTTVNNIAAGAVALPFAAAGAISYGISKPFKWARKKCFEHLDFSDFGGGILSCFMAVIGAASWIVEKTTKWVGRGLVTLANAPLHLANAVNKKMVGSADPLTKSDELREGTVKELKSLVKKQEKEKARLKDIGKKMDELKNSLKLLQKAGVVDDLEASEAVEKHLLTVQKRRADLEERLEKMKIQYAEHETRFNEAGKKIRDHKKKVEEAKKKRLMEKVTASKMKTRSDADVQTEQQITH